jgi:hypothetical protein
VPKNVNVIVTCTKKKTLPVLPDLMLRAVRDRSLERRAERWIDRIARPDDVARRAARGLYAGDHWAIIRDLDDEMVASGHRVTVWVCSAGYGLVSIRSELLSYSATFASRHPDSVLPDRYGGSPIDAFARWWTLLSQWSGPDAGQPRTIEQLVQRDPRSLFLVVASEVYLKALADDLRRAIAALSDPEHLSIISSGTKSLVGLESHLVPCDARFQSLVSGARRSLNVRLARKALLDLRVRPPTLSVLKEWFGRLLARQPEIQHFDRDPMSDAQVLRYIRSRLRNDGDARPTPLLRTLRDSGFACEQKRFSRLFWQVVEEAKHA